MENLNHLHATFGLGQINIGFFYQKYPIPLYSKLYLNLKWQPITPANRGPENRLKAFLGELLFLIRNKVIINGGSLDNTKLIWFYPSSMNENQKQSFSKIWNELFAQYITTVQRPKALLEAEAPFYMYDAQEVSSDTYPVVNIDIGGGTTDIVIFKNNLPKCITSVKFAGNSVWGDGYSTTLRQNNGFVTAYKPMVKEFLDSNRFSNLSNVLKQIETDKGQFGSAAFFFSIDKNREVVNKGAKLNIADYIANDANFKIVFLVFYASLIYYSARLMKLLHMEQPRNICLSGNGSRIIQLLNNMKAAKKLTKMIYETVYGEDYHDDGVSFVQPEEPKEATCKGGIKREQQNIDTNYDSLLWLGNTAGTVVNEEKVNFQANRLKYKQLTEHDKKGVVDEYKIFVDALETWHDDMDFHNAFEIDVTKLKNYIATLKKDAVSDLNKGLALQIGGIDSVTVSETLFFYPLIGGLYNLIQDIGKGLQTSTK
jgi:hypothetical protein